MNYIWDGLRNIAAGIGGRFDKASTSVYEIPLTAGADAVSAYATSIYRKAVDIKADDSYVKWRAWQGDKTQIGAIEAEENRLGLKLKFNQADKLAQVTGGAAIYLGGLPGEPKMPVNLRVIQQGAIKFATVLPKTKCVPGDRETNPLVPEYGQPKFYTIGTERVHPSRVIRFIGDEHIDPDTQWDGYGIPTYVAYETALKNLDLATATVASMIPESKLDVLRIPGLMELTSSADYEQRLMRRLVTANTLKSTTNALILDGGNGEGKGGEEFEQKTIPFAGLPDIMDRFMLLFSAAVDIPQTRLYGRSPQGMNSTGDSDLKNWSQTISARQSLKIDPVVNPLDEILIRSALGSRPPELFKVWNPIYTIDEKTGAEIEKMYAEAYKIRTELGSIDETVLSKAELNRMIESGRYPGIEDAIDESVEEGGINDPDEREAAEMERMNAQAEIAAQNVAE